MDTKQSNAIEVLTTEHFTLQTARSAAVQEGNGRIAAFLSAVSSGVVAIAFVGQASRFGAAFQIFTLVLLVPLIFVGIATFSRVLQVSVQDAMYDRGINRIRHFYREVAPDAARYLVLSSHDDVAGTSKNMGLDVMRWQALLTAAGVVALLNGVLIGVFVGLIARFATSASLPTDIALGIGVAIAITIAQLQYQNARYAKLEEIAPPEFPSP